jgi:TusA-related sulfurtransferase
VNPALVLDCRGKPCPLPVIELAKHLTDVEVGALIAVESDDVAAGIDIPAWCRMREQEFVGRDSAEDGVARYLVRRLG